VYELTNGHCNCNSNGLWHGAHRSGCRCYLGEYSPLDALGPAPRDGAHNRVGVRLAKIFPIIPMVEPE
jgi:hypothetical protein